MAILDMAYPGKYKNKQLPAIKRLFQNASYYSGYALLSIGVMPFTFGNYIKPKESPLYGSQRQHCHARFIQHYTGAEQWRADGRILPESDRNCKRHLTKPGRIYHRPFKALPITVLGGTLPVLMAIYRPFICPGQHLYLYFWHPGIFVPVDQKHNVWVYGIDVPMKPTIKDLKKVVMSYWKKRELAEKDSRQYGSPAKKRFDLQLYILIQFCCFLFKRAFFLAKQNGSPCLSGPFCKSRNRDGSYAILFSDADAKVLILFIADAVIPITLKTLP